jgi:sulfite exporter TauE/SafE
MDYAIAIGLGLIGSLHCAAMCGPLQLALPVPPGGVGRIIWGRLVYQLGRIMTYGLLGAAGGLIGKSLFVIGMQRWVSIFLGLAVLTGLMISKRVTVSAPAVRLVAKLKSAMSAQFRQRSLRSLALLGLLNGLLPCGLVYVALAGAVTLGNIGAAVAYMVAFGLGTVPMMLGLSLSGRIFPLAWRRKLNAAIPLGICLLASLLVLRGLGLGIPYLSPDLAATTTGTCCPH